MTRIPMAVALASLVAIAALASCADDGAQEPAISLFAAGYSFGLCGSPCRGDLELDGARVRHVVRGNITDRPVVENSGRLSDGASRELLRLLGALGDAPLAEVYGCPDCADGGASYVVLEANGLPARHAYEFGRPPKVLAALDAWVAAVIAALESCQANELVVPDAGCVALPRA